jgi:hypothetical protein
MLDRIRFIGYDLAMKKFLKRIFGGLGIGISFIAWRQRQRASREMKKALSTTYLGVGGRKIYWDGQVWRYVDDGMVAIGTWKSLKPSPLPAKPAATAAPTTPTFLDLDTQQAQTIKELLESARQWIHTTPYARDPVDADDLIERLSVYAEALPRANRKIGELENNLRAARLNKLLIINERNVAENRIKDLEKDLRQASSRYADLEVRSDAYYSHTQGVQSELKAANERIKGFEKILTAIYEQPIEIVGCTREEYKAYIKFLQYRVDALEWGIAFGGAAANSFQSRLRAAKEISGVSMSGKLSPIKAVADMRMALTFDEEVSSTDACELIAVQRMLQDVLSKLGGAQPGEKSQEILRCCTCNSFTMYANHPVSSGKCSRSKSRIRTVYSEDIACAEYIAKGK